MPNLRRLVILLLVALLPLGCVSAPPGGTGGSYPLTIYDESSGIWVPANSGQGSRLPQADRLAYQASGPYPVALDKLPPQAVGPDLSKMVELRDKGRIEKPIPEAAAEKLRAKALLLPPAAMVQRADQAVGSGPEPIATTGNGFDSLDYTDCCGGSGNVPADSELAVGPNHIIAVVNVAFEIYDKSGNLLQGPTTFASFFAGTPNCSGVFDPNVIYDEAEDRFILAIDANGKDYCIAVTDTDSQGDPTLTWNSYSFPTDVGRNFFDYPHAGVGDDAIYLGANMFGRRFFAEGRIWAIDKFAMYDGGANVSVASASTGGESTPQPMNLHGAQETWPVGGQHYFLTDGPYDGRRYGVWSWGEPFAGDVPVSQGTVDLYLKTGVTAGAPIDAPQMGGNPMLDGNDWRVQDAEYRNGFIWMTNTIACNPGGGTVDCVRWAKIDPTGPSVSDAGVYGSTGEYRIFADLAVDDCDNMAVGYTKTSSGMYPGVFVSGRESTDPVGSLQSEVLVQAGKIKYTSFQSGTTHRWGDYTAMTIDPDGKTFWYMGQYSKNTGTTSGRWGNWIAPFSFASCDGGVTPPPTPGEATIPDPSDGSLNVSISAVLGWTAGANTDSHKVYLGVQGSSLGLVATLPLATNYYDPLLNYNTNYDWRVDEVNAAGGIKTGAVWSFSTQADPNPPIPGKASSPSPSNGGSNVAINATLSWSAGANTTSHDVYFDTSSPPGFIVNQAGSTHNPPVDLAYGTTYYWRINEVNGTNKTTGDIWSFTTAAKPTLVGSATNDGKTWTAIVTAPAGYSLNGTWDSGTGSCVATNVCTLGSIPKKQAQVIFTEKDTNVEVPVLKP
jgi:hypothetical protein